MLKRDELVNPASCLSKAKDDEMLFVLLARDAAAPETIRFWIQKRLELKLDLPGSAKLAEAESCALHIEQKQVQMSSEHLEDCAKLVLEHVKNTKYIGPELSAAVDLANHVLDLTPKRVGHTT